jgi:hypothetical protein
MPDIDDDLFSSFRDEGNPVNPLPAPEVRRRGDRLRRRNNTLAAVGGVAALVVIAAPLAVVAGQGSDSSAPEIATQPARVEWLQEIPGSVDLASGLGTTARPAEVAEQPALATVEVCDETVFDAAAGTVDTAGATYTGDPNSGNVGTVRTLVLYPDGAAASDAVNRIRDAVDTCESDTSSWTRDLTNLPADDSFVVTQGFLGEGEDYATVADYYVVAHTGNALLVTRTAGVAPNSGQPAAEASSTAELIAELQVFSETAAIIPETDGTSSLGETIPDDFDLLAGFPEDSAAERPAFGREGPARDLDLTVYNFSPEACGTTAVLPPPTDTLYAGWREVAGGQLRQLMTFTSADDAQAYADALLQVYADCPKETDQYGATKVYELAPDPRAGDFAGSVVMHPEADGEVGPGYRVIQVVRVGQAVLQFVASYDVDPVDPATAVTDLTTTYLNANSAVIDAM